MASDNTDYSLKLSVRRDGLGVSHVSSTLRVIQAAVRETALGVGESSPRFEGSSQPLLLVDAWVSEDSGLTLSFYFADSDGAPLRELSAQALGEFMDEFGRALASRSQLGLWGRMARGSSQGGAESESNRRMDEIRSMLRRFGRASLSLGDRSITFDGDSLLIE